MAHEHEHNARNMIPEKAYREVRDIFNNYIDNVSTDISPDTLIADQYKIVGHMFTLVEPMSAYIRDGKQMKASYENKMRTERKKLIDSRQCKSMSEADGRAKAEYAALAEQAERLLSEGERLRSLYSVAEAAKLVISQHVKIVASQWSTIKNKDPMNDMI